MISKRDKNFIEICFAAACENETTGRARLSACIVHRNRIISVGYNHKKSSPFQAEYAKNEEAIYFHAETHAIKNFLRQADAELLEKSTLYIARAVTGPFKKKWNTANALPCAGCMRAIHDFQIGRVVYTSGRNEISELNEDTIEKVLLEHENS